MDELKDTDREGGYQIWKGEWRGRRTKVCQGGDEKTGSWRRGVLGGARQAGRKEGKRRKLRACHTLASSSTRLRCCCAVSFVRLLALFTELAARPCDATPDRAKRQTIDTASTRNVLCEWWHVTVRCQPSGSAPLEMVTCRQGVNLLTTYFTWDCHVT